MDQHAKLESALASFARYYMGNDDPEGLASDLLIILSEVIDTDAIAKPLGQALDDEVEVNQRLDGEEDKEEPDWLTNPCSTMAACHY